MNQNISILVGRLAMNPTLKSYSKADGSEGARFFCRLAVTRIMDRGQKDRTKQRTNWIPIVAWGDAAKRHAQYLKKGTQVTVTGEVICESTKNEDGTYTEFFYINANDIQYGAESGKNRVNSNDADRLAALEARVDGMTAGQGQQPISTPENTPAEPSTPAETPETEAGGNPFEEGVA